jgi:DNA-binding transcriptional ArsR family regulator
MAQLALAPLPPIVRLLESGGRVGVTVDRDVFQFIREHVRSVWALELLLRLKHDPERCWSVEELVGDLRASHSLVTDNLTAFEDAGLVVADDRGCFRYQPAAAVLAKVCDDLDATYRTKPVTVIRWISAPTERLQSLADAFKFKGKDR